MGIKITSLFDSKRSLWMKIKLTDDVIKTLHNVLKSINQNISGLESQDLDDWCGSSESHLSGINYFKDKEFKFFGNDEDIYIIFTSNYCDVIIFKDSKRFDKIKKLFLEKFN
ncbi:MAG: hypothetical protein AABX23_02090 [Nanoarchaeota archaeon]